MQSVTRDLGKEGRPLCFHDSCEFGASKQTLVSSHQPEGQSWTPADAELTDMAAMSPGVPPDPHRIGGTSLQPYLPRGDTDGPGHGHPCPAGQEGGAGLGQQCECF